MSGQIADPEVRLLAGIAGTLAADYPPSATDPWEHSPFSWIKPEAPARKGKIGEQLVDRYCAAKGLHVTKSPDKQADRIIEGRRVKIKSSMLWEDGIYKFQKIRDQDYEFLICLGLSPFDAHCWVIPKSVVMQNARPQHGGQAGTDTRWLIFPADNPPRWLAPYGGSLSAAYARLNELRS